MNWHEVIDERSSDLEHIPPACKGVTGVAEFIVIAPRRERDLTFVRELVRHDLVRRSVLRNLIQSATDKVLRSRLTEARRLSLRAT